MISSSGTFDSSTATSTFSAPDETWSFSFLVDSSPAVSNVVEGEYFDVSFSDFTYTVNGESVAITPADILFFNADDMGMFGICFIDVCATDTDQSDGFVFYGPQMYTGDESAPTMSTGTFSPNTEYVLVDGTYFPQTPSDVNAEEQATAPEPSTVFSLGAGLFLSLAAWRLRRTA